MGSRSSRAYGLATACGDEGAAPRLGAALLALLVVAAVVTGCGGDDGTTQAAPGEITRNAPATAAQPAPGARLSAGNPGGGHTVLVNAEGQTLYTFSRDQQGAAPTCLGSCAKAWPPLVIDGEPEPTAGVRADLIGSVRRPDGITQITYAGWPLYVKSGEATADSVSGTKAFGGTWVSIQRNGAPG